MTISAERERPSSGWTDTLVVPLASGAACYRGAEVGAVAGTYTASHQTGTTMLALGLAKRTAVYADGDRTVSIDLGRMIRIEYFSNVDSGNRVVMATDFASQAYFVDGGTVSRNSGDGAPAGLIVEQLATGEIGVATNWSWVTTSGATGATGATGASGATGATGASGAQVYFSATSPTAGAGSNNDVWFTMSGGVVIAAWKKITGTWTPQ